MHITIRDTVLIGNMGEGWNDVEEAARAYAEFLKAHYTEEASSIDPDAEIECSVTVQNASGWSRDVTVTVTEAEEEGLTESLLEERLRNLDLWDKWLNSDRIKNLI